jgi:hypothetical protein
MKTNWLTYIVIVLFMNIAGNLPAQQSEADRKLLADLRIKAEGGDAKSQYELGVTFDFGKLGVAKDYAEAVKWFRKAAEQNYSAAQENLGQCYSVGEGVSKDYLEAIKWWRKAAEQNYAPAQYDLGVGYEGGSGVPNDDV